MSQPADQDTMAQWSQQEAVNANERKNEELQAKYNEEVNPSRRFFHKFILLVRSIAFLAALNMAAGQILGFFFQEVGPVQYVLRLYMIGLCLLALLVELEWTKLVRESTVFQNWITRGLYCGFIGVVGLEQNDTSKNKNTTLGGFDISHHYIKSVAWVMVGVGSVYLFLGLVCLQRYYNKLRADYEGRLEKAPTVREATERYSMSNNNESPV